MTVATKQQARDLIAATFEAWVDGPEFVFGNKNLLVIRDRAVAPVDNRYHVMHEDYSTVEFECLYSALVFARIGEYAWRVRHYFKMHDRRLALHYRSAIDSKQLHTRAIKLNNAWRTELYMHKYNEAVHAIAVTKRLMQDYKINI